MSEPEPTAEPVEETKRCGTCKQDFPATSDYFGKAADKTDGFRTSCRECVNKLARARWAKKMNRIEQVRAQPQQTRWTNLESFEAAEAAGTADNWTPPAPPVPDGFDVRGISSQVDDNGDIEKQWIDARPEATKFEAIQAAIPPGHRLKGVSTLIDEHGGVRAQWIKTNIEQQAQTGALLDAIANICERWPARAVPTLPPESPLDSDLLCVYPMGDPHFGMYAWAAETGDDYDLELAAQYHATAMDELVESAPSAEEALIVDLGDFFHMDDSSNETKRSHHKLDVDTRWPKVVRHGVQSMIYLIKRSLKKHLRARVWIVPGNHDDHSAVAMQLALEMYFKDEPRVVIDPNPAAHFYIQFGRNLIGATHGHTSKLQPLGEIMAADRKVEWGSSDYYYWYVGHVHHDSMLETRGGVIVETMRTLAARDKWAADSGYRAGRDMKVDVIHKLDGRIHRNTVGIRQIKRRIARAAQTTSA